MIVSTRCFAARSPCFRAFCDERALPASVLGPRDFAPFLRLASARASLTVTARGAAPVLDMAGILRLEDGVGSWFGARRQIGDARPEKRQSSRF
jgi:hypothetical protein